MRQEREPAVTSPVLVVWQQDGMKRNPNNGLRLGVWDDGTILFSPSRDRLGQQMVVGRVEKGDIETMLGAIRTSGFFQARRDYTVPDARYASIAVRDGEQWVTREWHEYLLPGFGGDINTERDYRDFVRMWKKTSAAIEALAPIEIHRLSDNLAGKHEYRGYLVDEPWRTAWRP